MTAEPRTWDGSCETDADKRFFALRDSGYTGLISLDGWPVDDPENVFDAHCPFCGGVMVEAEDRTTVLCVACKTDAQVGR